MPKEKRKRVRSVDLIKSVAIKTGFDKQDVLSIIKSYLNEIKSSLLKDEDVVVRNFGLFSNKKIGEKDVHNIHTGLFVTNPEHMFPKFKFCLNFKESVKTGVLVKEEE